jgi:hypothetical protein
MINVKLIGSTIYARSTNHSTSSTTSSAATSAAAGTTTFARADQ